MALNFQYNKTALQHLRKQLAVREKALPTLKSKETALRVEVKKLLAQVRDHRKQFTEAEEQCQRFGGLWLDFPPVAQPENVEVVTRNILGVKVPHVEEIHFTERPVGLFHQPPAFADLLSAWKHLLEQEILLKVKQQQLQLLEDARKKTTQKVNLYEKVQIPAYEQAIQKVKRYLEDKENIAKASQKMLLERLRKREEAVVV